jgi:hypothetical protein
LEIEITKQRFILILLGLITAGLSAAIIGQPIVGHRASDLVGFVPMSSLPNFTSAKITDNGLDSVEFADNSFTTAKFLNSVVKSDHIVNLTLTEDDFLSIGANDIGSVLWGAVQNAPDLDYAVFGFTVPLNYACDHPAYPGIEFAEPNSDDVYVVYNQRISIKYNWTTSNASGCGGNPSANITEEGCVVYYQGDLGFNPPACDCGVHIEGAGTCS